MITQLRATAARLLHRPIFGSAFGAGRYALASLPTVRRGLHSVRYLVIDPSAGLVLGQGDEAGAALAAARRVLESTGEAANDASYWQQPGLFGIEDLPIPVAKTIPRHVSRRRREIHARTGGRCAYCDTPLEVDGHWHVEHQLPRALGGDDRPLNLVAACPACNLAKADRTALEFLSDPGAALQRD